MNASTRFFLSLTLAAAGCGGDDDDGDTTPAADGVFVLASDFASSVYGSAPADDLSAFEELGPAEGDTAASRCGERVAVLERTSGAVTILGEDLAIESNFSVADEGGAAPNPHDLACVSETKAYVTRFAQGTVAIVDLEAGAVTGTIDLSAHDEDGVPDMDAIAVEDGVALVSLERLGEDFAPRDGDGEIATIDVRTDEPGETITLPFANPTGRFRRHGTTGELLVACVGTYGAADGGIVGFRVTTDPHVVVTEETLGGDLGAFVVVDETHGFAVVAVDFLTRLVAFNPSDGTAGDVLIQSEGFDLSDLEWLGDSLVVADASATAPGLRMFALDGTETTPSPVDIGLPPRVVLALP
jgi:hypothetical protein